MAYGKKSNGENVNVKSVYDFHTFRNGTTQMIGALEDGVLKAIILYHLTQLTHFGTLMLLSGANGLDPITAQMVGKLKENMVSDAKDQFETHMFRLMPYWLEYSGIRGFKDDELVNMFNRVFGRSSAISTNPVLPQYSEEVKNVIAEVVPEYTEDHF